MTGYNKNGSEYPADNLRQRQDFKEHSEGAEQKAEGFSIKSLAERSLEKIGFSGEKQRQVKMLLLVLLIGVVLMIFSSCNTGTSPGKFSAADTSISEEFSTSDEEAQLEAKLSEVLCKIKGVGNVSVSVTLASGSRTEYAVNASTTVNSAEESSSDGSIKNTTQTTSSNDVVFEDNNQSPVVVQEIRAEVQGVLIVADGGDKSEVCSQITAAVSALLDIPVHKITVCATE
ncbi:MAG: hypothetical protein ACOX7J_02895 [Bacillota bacterium]|jgi:stage III sporulation protein AG